MIDKILQFCSKTYSFPFEHYDGTGGNEHYKFNDDIDKIFSFFELLNIEIKKEDNYEIDVDQLREEIKKIKYGDVTLSVDNEENIKDAIVIDDKIKNLLKNNFNANVENENLIQLRDYQLEVMEKLKKMYKVNNILKLIWSCGLGKTLFSIYIPKIFNYQKTIIGVPSLYLQKQFLKEILRVFPNKNNVLCVGGDNGCTTDKNKIKTHYDKNINEQIFIIVTYTSCYLIDSTYKFDFKIGDEAHHLVGVKNKETNNYKIFHNIKSKKTLFMTATEKRYDVENNKKVYSMDYNNTFGNYLDIKSIKWAIDNNKITDFTLLILSNTENEVNEIIKKIKIEVEHKELFISAFMTLKAINNYKNLTHVLICCNKTTNSDIINNYIKLLLNKDIFNNINKNDFYNESLHTNCENKNFNNEVEKFKNKKYGIISSVYIFGEGFDLPKLNGVVFAENMTSDIRIVQTALRPNRIDPNDDKKKAHIIIPYMSSNNIENNNASFNRIRMIVAKLRNVDESIEQKNKNSKMQH